MEDVPQTSPHSEPRSEHSDEVDIPDILMEDVPQTSPYSEPRSEPSHVTANSPLRMYDVQNSSRHDISSYSPQSDLGSASGNKSEDLPLNGALPHDSPKFSPPCIDQSENNSPLQDNLDLPDGALPHDSPHFTSLY